jgi:hypothetical protein
VAESGTERTVVNRAADLKEQVGPSPRPSHLLRLVHSPVDQEIRGPFGNRCPDTQARTVAFGVIHEPSSLAGEIVVDFVQCVPQLAGWHACCAVTAFTLEDVQDFADPLDREPGILGLAVPDPPVQSVDLLDNEGLRLRPARLVGRQPTRRLFRMVEAHRDVEPIEDGWLPYTSVGQDRPKTGTTVGEGGQVSVAGSAQCLEISADQHRDVGIAPRDGAEYLPTSTGHLDVADANLQMALAVVAAPDEGRIQADADGRRRGPGGGRVAKLLAGR